MENGHCGIEKLFDMEDIFEVWPELHWILDKELRTKTARTWELALRKSVLTIDDLQRIPFNQMFGPELKVSFLDHKRAVVHIAYEAGKKVLQYFHDELPVDLDVLVAGAMLIDVGKLLEYELDTDGKIIVGPYGKYLRHPFSGVSLAEACDIPPAVCHIIATHAGEGDLVKRTTEAYLVHHADYMTYLPFKMRLEI